MTTFVMARYDSNDHRLMKWDGKEKEIASWNDKPTLREACDGLMEHHATGSEPFGSREGTLDSLELSNQWPIPRKDLTLSDESLPWDN